MVPIYKVDYLHLEWLMTNLEMTNNYLEWLN